MELSLDMNKRYTYADYLTWWDDKTRELIHGFIRMMSPAPRICVICDLSKLDERGCCGEPDMIV